jgi:hypothetical protein
MEGSWGPSVRKPGQIKQLDDGALLERGRGSALVPVLPAGKLVCSPRPQSSSGFEKTLLGERTMLHKPVTPFSFSCQADQDVKSLHEQPYNSWGHAVLRFGLDGSFVSEKTFETLCTVSPAWTNGM